MLFYTEGFYNILRFVAGDGEDANGGHRVQKVYQPNKFKQLFKQSNVSYNYFFCFLIVINKTNCCYV